MVRLLVTGTVRYGHLQEYFEAVRRFMDYRRRKGYCVPQVFVGLSGGMNKVLMVFDYAAAKDWEYEQTRVNADGDYAHVATEMPYLEGSIRHELFQPIEDLSSAK
jgi:hypothetical protein